MIFKHFGCLHFPNKNKFPYFCLFYIEDLMFQHTCSDQYGNSVIREFSYKIDFISLLKLGFLCLVTELKI